MSTVVRWQQVTHREAQTLGRAIGPKCAWIYIALRSYVWGSFQGELGVHYSGGRLVARIGQARLARETGISRERLSSAIAHLRALGIVRYRSRTGRAPIYELGTVTPGEPRSARYY